MNLRFSTDFIADLESIQAYVRDNYSDVQAARRIATIVLDALEPLKKFPELGLDFDKRVGRRMIADHTTRMLVIEKKYLVFYVVHEKHLNILKLVGASTDYLNNLDTLFRHFSDI